jgi:hypothetical protein
MGERDRRHRNRNQTLASIERRFVWWLLPSVGSVRFCLLQFLKRKERETTNE